MYRSHSCYLSDMAMRIVVSNTIFVQQQWRNSINTSCSSFNIRKQLFSENRVVLCQFYFVSGAASSYDLLTYIRGFSVLTLTSFMTCWQEKFQKQFLYLGSFQVSLPIHGLQCGGFRTDHGMDINASGSNMIWNVFRSSSTNPSASID